MTPHPMLYLLSGLPCSGKTTYARGLESQGVVRVDVDAMMIESAGRLGTDYAASEHMDLLEPVFRRALDLTRLHLSAGDDVVLDHGLGRRDERDRLKRLASRCNANWTLLHFDTDIAIVRTRCEERLGREDAVPISDETLNFLIATYEPPTSEGEIIIA